MTLRPGRLPDDPEEAIYREVSEILDNWRRRGVPEVTIQLALAKLGRNSFAIARVGRTWRCG